MKVRNATKVGYIEVHEGGAFNMAYPESALRRGRVIDEGRTTPTLDRGCQIGVVVHEGREIRARRLTPRECFRLQGFPDDYFDRASKVSPERELYHQAGNSVTVNVIYEIAKLLKGAEHEEH